LTIALPPETEELARLVAARSGKTLEDVLKQGVEMEARIAGVAVATPRKPASIDRAREIAMGIASRPLLDTRPPRDILDQAWGTRDDRRR
jgi:antitoxin VapB